MNFEPNIINPIIFQRRNNESHRGRCCVFFFFCRTAVHTHTAAESRLGSRSWQGGDRDKSLIYWVHFLGSRAPFNTHMHTQTHTPPYLTAQGQRERGRGRDKRCGAREE